MGILDRYIGKTIFAATFLCLFVLIGLSGIIKFVEQMKSVGEGNYDVWHAAYFTILKTPQELTVFFPMAALIGSLIGLGSLASSSGDRQAVSYQLTPSKPSRARPSCSAWRLRL